MNDLDLLRGLEKTLPPVFSSIYICNQLGGILSTGRLANLDSEGKGPENRFFQGRTTCYTREDFLRWFAGRIKTPQKGRVGGQCSEGAEA